MASESVEKLAMVDQTAQAQALASAEGKQAKFTRAMDGLIKANALDYRLPPSLSVVVKRTYIRHNFDRNSYTAGQNMVGVLASGDMYIDGVNSYLVAKCRSTRKGDAENPKSANFGSGSMVNCFNRITLMTESGTEVERIESLNNFRNTADRWECSQQWVDSYGGAMGYKPESGDDISLAITAGATLGTTGITTISVDGTPIPISTAKSITVKSAGQAKDLAIKDTEIATQGINQFIVPLNRLAGLFNSRKLLPGLGLMSGLRMEIALEDKATAMTWGATTDANDTYEISDVSVMLDSYQLSDSILKTLNQQSANSSLEVVFETYDRTPGSLVGGQSVLNLDSKRAVSRAQWVFAKTRLQASATESGRDVTDSFASEPWKVRKYVWNLSGLFFPNSPLVSTFDSDAVEMYNNANYVFDKIKRCHKPSSVSYPNFLASEGIMGATLERSSVLSLSGLPVSGSRILQLRASYDQTAPPARVIDMYMAYIKLVRVFLDRAVVKE